MSRPPYLRRGAAAAVFLVAVAVEFRPTPSVQLPIAATDLPAGTTVTGADVEWLEVLGPFETVDLPAVVSRRVPAGAPISVADVDPISVVVPDDWLQIQLNVPESTRTGATVVAVMTPPTLDRPATGLVTRGPTATGFDELTALVAFSPADAVAVARAVAQGTVTVLLGR